MALAPPAATTTNAARKEIIRSVVDEITVLARGHSELVDLTLTWAGGQTSHITTRRPPQRLQDLSYYPQLVARIVELADAGMTPESIVIRLRAEGYRHSRDDCDIGWRAVEQILLRTGHTINRSHQPRRVHPDQAPHDNEWWLADLAAELGVTLGTIHHWRQQARLTCRQKTYPPLDPARRPGETRRAPHPPRSCPGADHPRASPLRRNHRSHHTGAACLTDGEPSTLDPRRDVPRRTTPN